MHSRCLTKFPINEAHGQERRGQKIRVCVSHSNIIEGRSHRKNTNQGSLKHQVQIEIWALEKPSSVGHRHTIFGCLLWTPIRRLWRGHWNTTRSFFNNLPKVLLCSFPILVLLREVVPLIIKFERINHCGKTKYTCCNVFAHAERSNMIHILLEIFSCQN